MYSVMDFWRNTLLGNVSVNAFPGNGYVLNSYSKKGRKGGSLSLEPALALVVRREDIVGIRYQATTNECDIAASWNIYYSEKENNTINDIIL
jgi:hypothetical protein